MRPEVLMYSTDNQITFWDIKNLKSNDISISISDLQKTQDIFVQNNIHGVVVGDTDYHTKLHNIPNKPYIMHYMWDISLLDRNILWIVWPRKNSNYSHHVLQRLFDCAKNYDLVTISGMAEWVDQLCHAFSVKHNIPTIAVLWWGIHHFLQSGQRHIIESIVDHWGLILSEFKIDFIPTKYSFPQRNRIVAWLCDRLFLPEAGAWSGSLITANFAYDLDKPVYTVPWDIFSPMEEGIFELIQSKKASFITDFSSFFAQNFHPNLKVQTQDLPVDLSDQENQILSVLSTKWQMSLDHLVQETNIDLDSLMMNITLLEMNEFVYQNMPGMYCLK